MARKLLCLVTAICSFWMSTSCYAQDAPGLVAFDEVDESTVLMTGFIPVLDSGLATVVYGNGTIYTVFYNPTTGKYAGAHVSSEQDDD